MSRSLLLPILGLAGIVLYGTTMASKNTAEAVQPDAAHGSSAPERPVIELEPQVPPVRLSPAPPPSPAQPPAAPDTLATPVEAEDEAL